MLAQVRVMSIGDPNKSPIGPGDWKLIIVVIYGRSFVSILNQVDWENSRPLLLILLSHFGNVRCSDTRITRLQVCIVKWTSIFFLTWMSLTFGNGIPTQMTALALLSAKSRPSETLPRQTAMKSAPSTPLSLTGGLFDVTSITWFVGKNIWVNLVVKITVILSWVISLV